MKPNIKPKPRKDRDAHIEHREAEVAMSLLDHHFDAKTVKKFMNLLVLKEIKWVGIDYRGE